MGGKVGTDIQDKKCSWLFAHAYHVLGAREDQALLDASYGQCKVGSEPEQQIKDMYRKLGLPELFQQYEEDVRQQLEASRSKIEAANLPWSMFQHFFALIHKRSK